MQSAAPAVYVSTCDQVATGIRTTTSSDRTTGTTTGTTTQYATTTNSGNCKYYTVDSAGNRKCWTGTINGVTVGGRRLLGNYVPTGSTAASGCTSTESTNELGQRVITTRCTGNATQYANSGTAQVSVRSCTQEDFDAQAALVAASEAKHALWKASYDRNAAVIDYNSNSGFCSCDKLCLEMGDCCSDMGWWCTDSDIMRAMTAQTNFYDFPYPGTMHFEVEVEEEEEVTEVVTETMYYIMVNGKREPYTPGAGVVTTTPTVTTSTGTTSRRCVNSAGETITCPTYNGTNYVSTDGCTRYTKNADGTKNCLN
jgi:hypothetical protein